MAEFKITKTFYWKELTKDGLLKEPEGLGPYYDTDHINPYGGFPTKRKALDRFDELLKMYEFGIPHSLVLISVYTRDYKSYNTCIGNYII